MNIEELTAEYDRFYKYDPGKWDLPRLDKPRWEILKNYDAPKTLLDVGCAGGHTMAYLSQFWTDTKFTGIDLSEVVINYAKKTLPEFEFICGDIENIELPKFDMIILCGTAEHFIEPLDGLIAVKELLKKNGLVYLEVPNCLAYASSEGKEGFIRVAIGSKQMEWHLKRKSWEKIIEAAGFEIAESIKGENQYNEFIWILK